jgi:hypothetical protein
MGDQIYWYVELSIRPGELENFCTLTGEMVDAARHESRVFSSDLRLGVPWQHTSRHVSDIQLSFASRLCGKRSRGSIC